MGQHVRRTAHREGVLSFDTLADTHATVQGFIDYNHFVSGTTGREHFSITVLLASYNEQYSD